MRISPPGVLRLLAAVSAATAAVASAHGPALDCRSGPAQLSLLATPGQGVGVEVRGHGGHVRVVVEERGHELEWRTGDGTFVAVDGVPPRLGIASAAIAAGTRMEVRAVDSHATASVELRCEAAGEELEACTARAQTLLRGDDDPSGGDVGTPFCQALLRHSLAAYASRNQITGKSSELYAEAIEAWGAAGDEARAAAARLGLAEQLYRQRRLDEALAAARLAETALHQVGLGLFAARAQAQQCLVLRKQGELEPALACLRSLPARYAALGEASDEANAWSNLAAEALHGGRLDEAEQAITQAQRIDTTRLGPLVAGRLHLQEAGIRVARGHPAGAIHALDRALQRFEAAGDGRWASETFLRASALYLSMGAPREAALFADMARERLPAGEQPTRDHAIAMARARAQLASPGAMAEDAVAALRQAVDGFRRLGMPVEALQAEVLLIEAGGLDPAMASPLPAAVAALSPRLEQDRRIAFATAHADAGRWQEAGSAARSVPVARLTLDQRLRLARVAARADVAGGNGEKAMREIEALVAELGRLAWNSRSPELRQLMAARIVPLRRVWVEAWSSLPEASRPAVSVAWNFLASSSPDRWLQRDGSASAPDQALVEAIAAALLAPGADQRPLQAAQRSLLQRGGDADAAQPVPAALTLARVQSSLSDGEVAMLFAAGETRSLVISAGPDSLDAALIASPTEVAARIGQLLREVSEPATPVSRISGSARAVSDAVLPPTARTPASRVWILADELFAATPFALLAWPGDEAPWIEHAALSLLAAAPETRSGTGGVAGIDVLIAPASAGAVADLAGSRREGALIASALAGVAPVQTRPARRNDFLQAIARPGAWVHVASHGAARAGLQGYAGLWLEREGTEPGFVSWLDAAAVDVRAGLVVLNACDLADNSDIASPAAATFAAALAQAGARDVVAARWQVSDAAAAHWVAPFYGHLAQHPRDVAEALRQAQLALRRSRMFRHPFYWASLVHLGHPVQPMAMADTSGVTAPPAAGGASPAPD